MASLVSKSRSPVGVSVEAPAAGRAATPPAHSAVTTPAWADAATVPVPPWPAHAPPAADCIRVRGAKEHNLKGIDVDIPRNRLVVITGLSGSGKSSLAFDTIFAEGQRKYMESLSAYARQFLDQLKKPDVEDIQGLPPTIAIEQRSSGHNPRSTVATSTEIYDYLRLLYARCGQPTCWAPTKVRKDGAVLERCGRPIQATASTQIIDAIMALGVARLAEPGGSAGLKMMILGPAVRAQKGFHRDVLEDLQKQGWGRVRVNGAVVEIREVLKNEGENPLKLERYAKHDIEVVIDRIVLKPAEEGARQRLADSVESALKVGGGTLIVSTEDPVDPKAAKPGDAEAKVLQRAGAAAGWTDRIYSQKHACTLHPQCALEELAPRLFSFNSPQGACPECHGLGVIMEFSPDLIIPDPEKTLAGGAVAPYRLPAPMGTIYRRQLRRFCRDFKVDSHVPVSTFDPKLLAALIEGTPKGASPAFPGVGPTLRAWYQKTDSSYIKEWLGGFMHEKTCPACLGDRLRTESLCVLLASRPGAPLAAAAADTPAPEPEKSPRAKAGKRPRAGGSAEPGALESSPTSPALTLNIAQGCRLNIRSAVDFIAGLVLTGEQQTIAEPILKEIGARLRFLASVGLEYLSLDRRTATLSGGEAQRIRLATQVGSGLVGAAYVLDEPTIGLHQRDNDRLIATLRRLADIGNSVLVVEHDEDMIRAADWILDVGPGPGVHGGRIVAQGRTEDIIAAPHSITGLYLSRRRSIPLPARRRDVSEKRALCVKGARQNNLKNLDAAFPLGGLVCVTGVSGSGKSTLVNDILLAAAKRKLHESRVVPGAHDKVTGLQHLDRVVEVDQSPIGRTPRSNPATYTGMFDEIRKVFTDTKESKIRGYKPGRFSFNVTAKNGGGRCESCEGQGLKRIEMHFLPDVYVACETCDGSRYNRETLEVKFRGRSIADVLDMTVEQGLGFFENHPKILRTLRCLHDVGLDYVKLGQPSTQLSGGEAQRIKLATELAKGPTDPAAAPTAGVLGGRTLYVLDEPTTGLHFEDIRKLVLVLDRLASAGHTLVVIEHNLDVIKCADWLIDLGPEGGDQGGAILAAGTPEAVAANPASHTGRYLKPLLAG